LHDCEVRMRSEEKLSKLILFFSQLALTLRNF